MYISRVKVLNHKLSTFDKPGNSIIRKLCNEKIQIIRVPQNHIFRFQYFMTSTCTIQKVQRQLSLKYIIRIMYLTKSKQRIYNR